MSTSRAGWSVLRSSRERLNGIIGSKVTENRAMERMDYRGRERGARKKGGQRKRRRQR